MLRTSTFARLQHLKFLFIFVDNYFVYLVLPSYIYFIKVRAKIGLTKQPVLKAMREDDRHPATWEQADLK